VLQLSMALLLGPLVVVSEAEATKQQQQHRAPFQQWAPASNHMGSTWIQGPVSNRSGSKLMLHI